MQSEITVRFSELNSLGNQSWPETIKYWRVRLTGRFLFLDGSSVTTGAGAGGGGGGSGGSVGGSVGGNADAYRQSSSASPRGVVTGGGYCGSSASTPHSHSTNGSYSVANPYTGSPTLYTSRKFSTFSLSPLSLSPLLSFLSHTLFLFSSFSFALEVIPYPCNFYEIQVVPRWYTMLQSHPYFSHRIRIESLAYDQCN